MGIRKSKYMTDEQFMKAKSNGLKISTVTQRIKRGMSPEQAVMLPVQKVHRDWDSLIFALYRGKEYITNGNVYEIDRDTGYYADSLKNLIYHESYNDPDYREDHLKLMFLCVDEEPNDIPPLEGETYGEQYKDYDYC